MKKHAAKKAAKTAASTITTSSSGFLRYGEQREALHFVYVRKAPADDDGISHLEVLVASGQLPEAAFTDDGKLEVLARAGMFMGLLVKISPDGYATQTALLHRDGQFHTNWDLEPDANKPDGVAVAGRVTTGGEKEFFGTPYEVDATFAVSAVGAKWSGDFRQQKSTGLAVGGVRGGMNIPEPEVRFTHGIAIREADLFGPERRIVLLFSTTPVPAEATASPRALDQFVEAGNALAFRCELDDAGGFEQMRASFGEGRSEMVSPQFFWFEPSPANEGEMEGRVSGSETWIRKEPPFIVDVTFRLPVVLVGEHRPVTATNGIALSADGGEPGKAYRAYRAAIAKAKHVAELLPFIAKINADRFNEIPADQRDQILVFLRDPSSSAAKLTGGFANDNEATLWLETPPKAKTHSVGRVAMIREGGEWKLKVEQFRDAAP